MAKRRRAQRCTANCADGSRCGKWCRAGEVVCARHKPDAPPTPVEAQWSQDPRDILERLSRSKDESIRLRATTILLDRLEKRQGAGCERCADTIKEDYAREDVVSRMTPAQRLEVTALIAQITAIREVAREQPVYVAPTPSIEPPPAAPPTPAIPTTDLSPTQLETEDDGIDFIEDDRC
jgi:hypothetical protein